MEDEDGEERALLGGRPEADSAVQGSPRALPALCDPSHLAHRLVVLSLMCFLGFGEPGCAGADDRGIQGFASPDSRCCRGSGARFFQVSRARWRLFLPSPECGSSSLGTQLRRNLRSFPRALCSGEFQNVAGGISERD